MTTSTIIAIVVSYITIAFGIHYFLATRSQFIISGNTFSTEPSVSVQQPASVEITSSDPNSLDKLSWEQLKGRVQADEKQITDVDNDLAVLSKSKTCTRVDMVNQAMTWKDVAFLSEGPVIFMIASSSIASSTLYFPNAHPDIGLYFIYTNNTKIISNTISFGTTSNPTK